MGVVRQVYINLPKSRIDWPKFKPLPKTIVPSDLMIIKTFLIYSRGNWLPYIYKPKSKLLITLNDSPPLLIVPSPRVIYLNHNNITNGGVFCIYLDGSCWGGGRALCLSNLCTYINIVKQITVYHCDYDINIPTPIIDLTKLTFTFIWLIFSHFTFQISLACWPSPRP